VSFDVFFQGFLAGESSDRGGEHMRAVVEPYVTSKGETCWQIRCGDGGADVYMRDDGMMANHISGEDPWDLLVRGARAANWVILPLDCPVCLTQPGQLEQLPDGLDGEVVVVESGADLRAVIESH
jgi:hypothetical protein